MASQYEELEKKITALKEQVKKLAPQKSKARKKREYTEEQKAAIRKRLLAGQEAARKRKEVKIEPTKKAEAPNNNRKPTKVVQKVVQTEKPNLTKPVIS